MDSMIKHSPIVTGILCAVLLLASSRKAASETSSQRASKPMSADQQLDDAMAEFVNDPRHCRDDPAKGIVTLSKIFDWFQSDFEGYEAQQGNPKGSLINYVNRFRGDDQIAADTVEFFPYDKGLNRQE